MRILLCTIIHVHVHVGVLNIVYVTGNGIDSGMEPRPAASCTHVEYHYIFLSHSQLSDNDQVPAYLKGILKLHDVR